MWSCVSSILSGRRYGGRGRKTDHRGRLYVLALTAIAGGVMAIGLAALRGRLKETLFNVGALARHHSQSGLTPHPEFNVLNTNTLRLPYALAIAAGCTLTLYFQVGQR